MRRRIYPLLLILIIPISGLFSQDFHYSQFYNEPLNFNPSMAGEFEGDKRIVTSLRDQYRSVSVPYFTLSGSYDMKFIPDVPKRGFFSAGVVFNYDKQGASNLTLLNFNIAGSYTYFLNSKSSISGGALVGYANRGFSKDDLRWDNQWDVLRGEDPTIDPGEPFESFRFSYLETGLGLNYKYQHSHRNSLIFGVSGFHLTKPTQNFYGADNDQLDMRLSLLGIANVKIAQSLDFQFNLMYQQQDVYKEIIIGGIGKVYLNNKRGNKLALHLGLLGRLGEGLAPKIAVEYNEWYVGMNYDIVTKTHLSEYTNFRGGPEVHVRYTISKVRPFGEFKICPIY